MCVVTKTWTMSIQLKMDVFTNGQVGPVKAFIKVKIFGVPNGRMFPNTPEMSQMVFFYALEACFVNFELPEKLFFCSDVSRELWSFLVSLWWSSKLFPP